jgi:hypothetical protein
LQQLARFAELFEDFLDARCVSAVILFDSIFDLLGRRNDNIDLFAQGKTEVLSRAKVERINQCDAQNVPAHSNRKRAVQPRQPARNQAHNFRRYFPFAKIDLFRPEPISNGLVKAALIDKATIDHGLSNSFSVELRFVENVIGLRPLQHLLLDKKLSDLFVVHGLGESLNRLLTDVSDCN